MILRATACLLLTATIAAAQPSIQTLAPGARIDAARERVRDEALSGAQRLDALRALIDALESRLEMRDIPIETRARDAAELAESLLNLAAWQGLQTTASVGILTPGMREESRAIARRALDAAALFDRATAGERETDDTLLVRVRMARARAGLMLAASARDGAERRAGLDAASAVREVPTLLRGRESSIDAGGAVENAEAEAQRLLMLGHLAALDGDGSTARDRFDAAREVALATRTRAEAILAHALALRAVDGPDAAYGALSRLEQDDRFAELERNDPLVRLLRADALRRAALAGAEFARGEALQRVAANAGAPYMALAERGAPGIDAIALRAVLLEKAAASGGPLRSRLDADSAPSRVAAFERVAAALADDAEGMDDALRVLRDDEAAGALGPFRADAQWRAGNSIRARENDAAAQREAALLLLAMAEAAPDDPRAASALGAAAASAQRLSALTNESEDSLDLYERALRAAVGHAGNDTLRGEALRFELGRVLALRGRDADASQQLSRVSQGELGLRAAELLLSLAQRSGDESRVADAAELVRSRASALLDAGENQAAQRALDRAGAVSLSADLRAAIARNNADAAGSAAQGVADSGAAGWETLLRDEALAIVERLAEVERSRGELNDAQRAAARVAAAVAAPLMRGDSARDGDRVLHARAQRMTGDAALAREAAGTIESVMARAGRSPELLAELAEALRVAGDDERAFAIYRELSGVARADDPRTRQFFWLAWGRMLATLAANNADGSRSATIRAQVGRLRLIDPDLGGSPHRERIESALREEENEKQEPSPTPPTGGRG